jgi:HprK-related kinase B
VQSNDAAVLDALREYYACFVTPPAAFDIDVQALDAPAPPIDVPLTPQTPRSGKTRIKDEYHDYPDGRLLRKRVTGMQFYFGPDHAVAVGACRTNLNQIVNFINNRFMQIQFEQGFILAHASGVARNGRVLAMAGMPGRGKSTLALHLLNRGFDFVTNDGLLMRRTDGATEVLGLAKYPRVNPGTLLNNPRLVEILPPAERDRLRALPPANLWALEQKYDVDVNRYYGPERMQTRGVLAGALILNWQRDNGPPRFAPADLDRREDLLAALMKPLTVAFFPQPGRPLPDFSAAAYRARLAGCPIYEAAGGADFDRAADWCAQRLA